MIVLGQKWFYLGKKVLFGQKWLRANERKMHGMKVLINHFKESGLAPKSMLRTQRSHQFSKPEKWLTFGILAKGGPHDNFLESFNFTNG